MSEDAAREKILMLSDDLILALKRDLRKQGSRLEEFRSGRSTEVEVGGFSGVATITISFKVQK